MSLKTLGTKSTHTPKRKSRAAESSIGKVLCVWPPAEAEGCRASHRNGPRAGLAGKEALAAWIPYVLSVSEYHTLQRHPPHHTLSSLHFSRLLSVSLGLKCPSAYGTVWGEVQPLKWEVWPVKMSHWEWDFEGHRVAGALLTSWFIKMNTSHTMDRLPLPWPFPQSGSLP